MKSNSTTGKWLIASGVPAMVMIIAIVLVTSQIGGSVPPIGGDDSYLMRFLDSNGIFANYSTAGRFDMDNEFFQPLGTNGRSCATCHRLENGMSFTTETARRLFQSTEGRDPLFARVDGTNRPDADLSTTEKRLEASSLLLNRGVIRIPARLPSSAEFTVESVSDPYGYSTPTNLNFYRRPLVAGNLKFVVGTTIMWDGREPDLASQANNAHISHAEALPLTPLQRQSIVDFETSLFTAQVNTFAVGTLIQAGGGPVPLSAVPFAVNTNSPVPIPSDPLTRNVFTLYHDWADSSNPHKQAVLRGQAIFNFRALRINAVTGTPLTCTSCHAGLQTGGNDHADINAANTGVAGLTTTGSDRFLATDLPIYTLRNKLTGATVRVNDLGRAAVSGLWVDVGRFQIPGLRGLASRPPFFHNGMAKTLQDVVNFYGTLFGDVPGNTQPPLTEQEKADLVAFLETL